QHEVWTEPDLARPAGQGGLAHEPRAQEGELAFGRLGPELVQAVRDHHPEHGVAQELEALIGFQGAARALVDVRSVDESRLEQRDIAERIAERLAEDLGGRRRVVHRAGRKNQPKSYREWPITPRRSSQA